MSTDEVTHLVNMANDIATNISPGKNNEQAVDAVRTHLSLFWTPAMRDKLSSQLATLDDALHPIARQALQ